MYIGLWSRLEGFRRESLTRALERRTVVQATLLRTTIHLVSARDFWPMTLAIRDARRDSWMRSARARVDEDDVRDAVRVLRERLAAGPLRRKEMEELLGRDRALRVGLYRELVRVPPSGTWEHRRADLYGDAEDWLGPPTGTREEGVELLVRRYLGGFGPAPPADIANWAGLAVRDLAPALERLRLRRFRDERGRELLDLPRAPLPDAEAPAPVRFLPTWDATLLVHARRTQILPEEHRPRVFSTKTPQSVATFLVDGRVAGTWHYEKGRVATEPFGRLDAAARRELAEEADRLAAFHAD